MSIPAVSCRIEAGARLLPNDLVSLLATSVSGEIEEISCNGVCRSIALDNLKFESLGWKLRAPAKEVASDVARDEADGFRDGL